MQQVAHLLQRDHASFIILRGGPFWG